MARFFAYLRDRFNEAGSKRSLAVVLFAISSATNSPDVWSAGLDIALIVLGGWSFLQAEQKPMVVSVSTEQTATAVGVAVQTQDKPA